LACSLCSLFFKSLGFSRGFFCSDASLLSCFGFQTLFLCLCGSFFGGNPRGLRFLFFFDTKGFCLLGSETGCFGLLLFLDTNGFSLFGGNSRGLRFLFFFDSQGLSILGGDPSSLSLLFLFDTKGFSLLGSNSRGLGFSFFLSDSFLLKSNTFCLSIGFFLFKASFLESSLLLKSFLLSKCHLSGNPRGLGFLFLFNALGFGLNGSVTSSLSFLLFLDTKGFSLLSGPLSFFCLDSLLLSFSSCSFGFLLQTFGFCGCQLCCNPCRLLFFFAFGLA